MDKCAFYYFYGLLSIDNDNDVKEVNVDLHLSRVGKEQIHVEFWSVNLFEINHLENKTGYSRTGLTVGCILGKQIICMGRGWNWLRVRPMAGFDISGVETSGSVTRVWLIEINMKDGYFVSLLPLVPRTLI
jgi:hypothetical protein